MNLNSILNILNHMKSYDYNNSLKKKHEICSLWRDIKKYLK